VKAEGETAAQEDAAAAPRPLDTTRAILLLFCRLSLTAFGGPVAHVALLREELVGRRGWVSDREFLEVNAVTNLLPGPNSTELAMALGGRRGGRRGLLAAGFGFIVPASLVVLAVAWLYVAFGTSPPLQAVLAGVKPVVIALIALAVVALARALGRDALLLAVAVACLAGYLAGVDELALLALGALAGAARSWLTRPPAPGSGRALSVTPLAAAPLAAGWLATLPAGAAGLLGIAAVFLKAGALLFGSGYVLIAFLRADLVQQLGWLTDQQLLDAVAVGQATPGPLFTTATFVGYQLAGLPGAVIATVAIFLPAFVFVLLLEPVVRALHARDWTRAALGGLSAAALGLMAGVGLVLAEDAFEGGEAAAVDPISVATFAVALVLLRLRLAGPTVVIVAGALLGLARSAAGAG
jgi:chromate transporter